MKRMHIHVGVKDIKESVRFYAALFSTEPVKLKPDSARWTLEDPHLNYAISTRTGNTGLDHMGLQVDDAGELTTLRDQMSAANISTPSNGETTCCYAKSEKSWVEDPNGIAWETYHTMEDAQTSHILPNPQHAPSAKEDGEAVVDAGGLKSQGPHYE